MFNIFPLVFQQYIQKRISTATTHFKIHIFSKSYKIVCSEITVRKMGKRTKLREVITAVNDLDRSNGVGAADVKNYLGWLNGSTQPQDVNKALLTAVKEGFLESKNNKFFPSEIEESRRRRRSGRRRRRRSRSHMIGARRRRRSRRSRRGRRHADEPSMELVELRRRRKGGRRRRRRSRRHAAEVEYMMVRRRRSRSRSRRRRRRSHARRVAAGEVQQTADSSNQQTDQQPPDQQSPSQQ